jgi:hypothetical protein
MHYKAKLAGLSTGATANAHISLVGLKFANTAGHRARLRRLVIGGGGGAPQDVQVSFRLRRTGNTGDGTATNSITAIAQADPGSIASKVSALGSQYTVEPTTFEAASVGGGSVNARATFLQEWTPDEAPVWGPNQTLCLEAAPGSAVATLVNVSLEWEEF